MKTVKEAASILVVDDEAIVRESITDWLRETGHWAVPAETGEQALEMIASSNFSLLILDYRLPGKNGIEVLRQARAINPDIKAIIITAFPSDELSKELKMLGADDDLLIKPVEVDDLERLVARKQAGAMAVQRSKD